MRQLIARIDERLHEELKARAASEGRSMNAVVTDLLVSGLGAANQRGAVRARADAAGLRVVPHPQGRAPSRDAAISATKGAGRAASRALAADRARR